MRDADIAMYRAKSTGGGRYQVFDQVMHEYALGKLHLENDLRQAIERQEFRVDYQPIIFMATGKISGFEALVRWCHPARGLVGPNEFIPLAEETGLIIPIGAWVLQTACEQLTVWQAKYNLPDTFSLSVNLSVKQLKYTGFFEQVAKIIYDSKIDPSNLKLELTESMLIDNSDNLIQLLFMLHTKGIQFSIDDFGTGFSCLSYLHRFPVDTLKIDRSFIDSIEDKTDSNKLIETIIALAHQFGMTATAEGVETIQQLRQLENLQCDEAQGYFFAPPLELQAAEQFLADAAG